MSIVSTPTPAPGGTAGGAAGPARQPGDAGRVAALLGVLFGIAGMGSSSASMVLVDVSRAFDVTVGQAAWTISLYVLMLAVATAVYGRICDLVGARTPLLIGVALMTVGAFAAAVAPSYAVLLVARLVQGLGAAAIPTLGVAVVSNRYHGAVRGVALGRLAGFAAAVSCLGPLVGGAVEAGLGWRAVMALPMLSLLLLPLIWPALHTDGIEAELDVVGALLVAAAAAGLVLLVQSPSTGVLVAVVGGALVVLGAPLVALWVRRRPHGFLPLAVVANPRVVRSALAAAAVPASWFASLVAIPAVLVGHGWEPWQVGVLLLPSAALSLLAPRLTAYLLDRVGAAGTLVVATAVAALAMLVAAAGCHYVSPVVLVVGIVLVTVAFGLGQPALMAAVGAEVPDEVRGVALGVATLVFLVGGSVGSAVVGGLGSRLGIDSSVALLAVMPLLGLAGLVPSVLRSRRATA